MTIDDLVRDTVHGLADEAGSAADLATGAMVRGRRLRRRQRAGMAVAAVALLGVAAVPYQWVQGQRAPARPVASQAQSWWERPLALPGGWVATSLSSRDRIPGLSLPGATNLLVLNRSAGRYESLEWVSRAWPAPVGDLVAVEGGDSRHSSQVGVRNMTDGSTRWFKGEFNLDPQWSADGRRLLLSTQGGFTVVDTSTGRATAHPVDDKRYKCTDYCLFTWQPDGLHVALPLDDPAAEPAEGAPDVPVRKGIQLFSADTGRVAALLPVHGNPPSSAAWSPDGRFVLLGEAGVSDLQVADVASGRVIRTLRDTSDQSYFVDNDRLLSIQSGSVRLTAADTGKVVEQIMLPDGLEGRDMTAARGAE